EAPAEEAVSEHRWAEEVPDERHPVEPPAPATGSVDGTAEALGSEEAEGAIERPLPALPPASEAPSEQGAVVPAAADSDPVPSASAPSRVSALELAERSMARPTRTYRRLLWVGAVALVLGGIVAGAFFRSSPPPPLLAVPFTSFPGEESEPALSPDGERLAFVWDGGGEQEVDLYVKQVGAETPLRITDAPGRERSPAWSPDGRQVAFVRSLDGDHVVLTVPTLGGGEREIAEIDGTDVGGLVWSPDGTTLALSVQERPQGGFALYLLDVETRAVRRLTRPPRLARGDTEPAFSPDGRHVAFVRSGTEGDDAVFVVPVSGGEPRRVTTGSHEINGLDWDTRGGSIVYASVREGGAGLWRVSAAGGRPEWIASAGTAGRIGHPSVSGGRLTYEQRSTETNVWSIGPRGRMARFIHSTRWDSHPSVGPDGRIAFASERSGTREIWTADPDGTHPVQLTELGALSGSPSWSPDGRRIAFDARPDGNADIFVIDAGGGRPVRLTDAPADDVAPSWSNDSLHVYFASNRSGRWEVWRVPAAGGEPSRVTYRGGYYAAESSDGRFLYYTKKNEAGLWRRPLEGGPETLVLGALAPEDAANWTVLPTGIYFIRRTDTSPSLRFYNFAAGHSMRVTTLQEVPDHPSLAVAPGGQQLLISQIDRAESDIVLVEDFR
ncbi:MAG: hypothetical protein R3362_09465, partial [Rhodothermales bacterium]|nr:hypothetical protein [Rhodothermales bacterium]